MTIVLNGTTGLTTNIALPAGSTSLAPLDFTSGTNLTTPISGAMEYDGTRLMFTPIGTQRGVIPGMQIYRLDSGLAGANSGTAQSILGVGVTLTAGTVYAFEHQYALAKTAGTTSHTVGYSFGGTATINNILWYSHYTQSGVAGGMPGGTSTHAIATNVGLTGAATSTGITTASIGFIHKGFGTISINAGGTLIPQYNLSAAPGGAYTTTAGSYFAIWPIGAAGANINVGTWA